jgi:hypothetical protein
MEGESAWKYNHKFKYAIRSLAHPIHEDHQREWYIQGLLPLKRINLTQQWIATLTDALEHSLKIESMETYPENLRMTMPPVDANLSQIH